MSSCDVLHVNAIAIGKSCKQYYGISHENPVQEYVMSLLPCYFPKDLRTLLVNTFLTSLSYDDNNVIIIGAGSQSLHCDHVTIIGTDIFAVNCKNCVIHRVGRGSRVYLNYTERVFNDTT